MLKPAPLFVDLIGPAEVVPLLESISTLADVGRPLRRFFFSLFSCVIHEIGFRWQCLRSVRG